MIKILLILLAALAVAAILFFEGWRQSRKLRSRGHEPGSPPSLIGTGMLEFQKHLQPDRKVEVMMEEMKDRDRVNPAYRPARPGDRDPEV